MSWKSTTVAEINDLAPARAEKPLQLIYHKRLDLLYVLFADCHLRIFSAALRHHLSSVLLSDDAVPREFDADAARYYWKAAVGNLSGTLGR